MNYNKRHEYNQREIRAAISAMELYVDCVERMSEKDMDALLHCLLAAAASTRKIVERNDVSVSGDALASIDAGIDDIPNEETE